MHSVLESGWREAGAAMPDGSTFAEVDDASTTLTLSLGSSGDGARAAGSCLTSVSVGVWGGTVALVETC